MKSVEDRIRKDGDILPNSIVKVDNFLNHQVDPAFLMEVGKEIKHLYKDEKITKILTIEASGIAIAAFTAIEFGVPFVFAKKYSSLNLDKDVYQSEVFSYTKQKNYSIRISSKYLGKDDRVLLVDDVLARGAALKGLIDICNQAGATVAGCAIVMEKTFQSGGNELRKKGIRIESLAKISSIDNGNIVFE